MLKTKSILLLSGAILYCSASIAQDNSNLSTDVVNTPKRATEIRNNSIEYSESAFWQLTKADWNRYQEIMDGPQGRWTPNEDPTFVLGQWARTPQELRRFAEAQVEIEKKRAERGIAFELAYQEAWNRLYPNLNVIDERKLASIRATRKMMQDLSKNDVNANQPGMSILPWEDGLNPADHLILLVSNDCLQKCDLAYQEALNAQSNVPGVVLDIFFIDFTTEDINEWALSKVALRSIKAKSITLNRNGAELQDQLKTAHGVVGNFYRRRGNQYGEIVF